MNILAMDTSSDKLLLAVLKGNKMFISQKREGKYMETLLPLIDELLAEAELKLKDLNTIGVVVGPGSFTGIRIGVATVKGFLQVFKNIKVAAINSLDLLAYTTRAKLHETDITAIIPSTASKLYVGRFKNARTPRYSLEDVKGFDEDAVSEGHYDLDINVRKVDIDEKNLIDFCVECLKSGKLGDFKPYYLALSQAEAELLKKEGSNA